MRRDDPNEHDESVDHDEEQSPRHTRRELDESVESVERDATNTNASTHESAVFPHTICTRSLAHAAGMLVAVGVVGLVAWKIHDTNARMAEEARLANTKVEATTCVAASSDTHLDALFTERKPIPVLEDAEFVVVDDYVPSDNEDNRIVYRGDVASVAVGCGASAPRSFSCRAVAAGGSRGRPGGSIQRVSANDVLQGTPGTETYSSIDENEFQFATNEPLSTFSIDVDTASYSNVRRFLDAGNLPPRDAVRIEELVNYFHYTYPAPEDSQPFSNVATVATCPWAPTHQLVQIGLRSRDFDETHRIGANLVFLIDVSGSMSSPDKLPLLVRSLEMLVEKLDERDRLAIVVYAGISGLVLPSTTCEYRGVIRNALQSLRAGGSTNGGAGIELAYRVAADSFLREGQNRVVLCTDGDFNVGVSDRESLVRLIEEKRQTGVFLSVLGFGTGNVKDSTMEMLADKGNGNYAYVDSLDEARKVLVAEMGGTLFTVAKDVKIQVEFNPARVQAWRLIGYENRKLAARDFNDDTKDAGEIGAGHTVTALYEIVPVDVAFTPNGVDPLRYQPGPRVPTPSPVHADELLTLKLRYKDPNGETSRLLTTRVGGDYQSWAATNDDFRFAAAVASFGMVLRQSPNVGNYDLEKVLYLALPALGTDPTGARAEFVRLVRQARSIVSR